MDYIKKFTMLFADNESSEKFNIKYETGFDSIKDALLGGEIFLFLFITSGQFKRLIPMPVFLPSFFDLTLIFMVLTLGCAVYRAVKNKFRLPWAAGMRMLIPYMIILCAFIVSGLYEFSLTYNYGYNKIFDYVVKLGFTVSMPFFVLSSKKSLKRFFTCLVIYTGIMAFETTVRYFINGIGKIGFIDVLGTSYMHASRYMCAGFIVVFALILGRLQGSKKRYAIAYCVVMLFAVLVGGARASGLIFYVLLFFPILLYIPIRGRRLWSGQWIRRYSTVFGALFIASVILFMTPLTQTFKYRMGVLPSQSGTAQQNIPIFEDVGYGEDGDASTPPYKDNNIGYVPPKGPPGESPYERQLGIKRQLNMDYGIDNSYIHPEWAEYPSWLKYYGVYNQGYGVVNQVDNTERHFWNSLQSKNAKRELEAQGKNTERLSRFEFMRYAINMITKRPIIGWGPGSFPIYVFNVDARIYPHNMFLEAWAEGGFFAFAGFLSMIGIAVWRVLRAWFKTRSKSDNWVYIALAMLLAFWLSMTMFVDFVNGCRILFMIMAVCMMVPYNRDYTALLPDPICPQNSNFQ